MVTPSRLQLLLMKKPSRKRRIVRSSPKRQQRTPLIGSLIELRQSVEIMRGNLAFILGELPTLDADPKRKALVAKTVKDFDVDLGFEVLSEIDEMEAKVSARAWGAAKISLMLARASIEKDLTRFHRMVVGLKGPGRRAGADVLSVLVMESGVNIYQASARFHAAAEALAKGCATGRGF